MQKTTHPKLADLKKDVKWYVLDAEGKVLGDVAAKAANVLRGKHKAIFHPSVNCGDHVVIINSSKVVLTGNKETKKEYIHYTGFPGGLRTTTAGKLRKEKPTRMVELAIKGMLPANRLRQHALNKLHVYAGNDHPHTEQKPQPLTLD